MGDTDPVGLVKRTVTDPAALEQVLCGTAKRFFGIAP
jgi:hypothetical protein